MNSHSSSLDADRNFLGNVIAKLTIIGGTPEKWAALTERQKHGLDEPGDSEPQDECRLAIKTRFDDGTVISSEATGTDADAVADQVTVEHTAKLKGVMTASPTALEAAAANVVAFPLLERVIEFALGQHEKDNAPENRKRTIRQLYERLQKVRVGAKEGPYLLQGSTKGLRNSASMDANYLCVGDIDCGDDAEHVEAQIRKAGLLAVMWETYSHGATRTAISEVDFRKHRQPGMAMEDIARDFLRETKQYCPGLLDTISKVEHGPDKGRAAFIVHHAPMSKLRVVLFLSEPFRFFVDDGRLHIEREEEWKARYKATFAALGLVVDGSCADPSRLMYLPAHAQDKPAPRVWMIEGALLELAKAPTKETKPRVGEFQTSGMMDFLRSNAPKCFDAVAFMRAGQCKELKDHGDGKVEFSCPNINSHTNPAEDAMGFVARSGNGTDEFWMFCQHTHCKGADGRNDRAKLLDIECVNRDIKHANELLAWCPGYEAKPFAQASDTALTRLTVDLPTHPLPEPRTITVASDTLVGNVHHGALALGEQQANLFIRGDKLVSIIETRIDHTRGRASYAQRLAIVDDFALLMNLSAAAKWQRYDGRSQKMKPIDCPEKVAKALLRSPQYWHPLRTLSGVIHAPTLRKDGTILDQPGYDPPTGLMFDPLGVAFPTISARPSKEEASTALALLKHLLAEFPFTKPQCLAVALSGILTTLARAAMSTAPLHAFTAPTPGTGKGFLVDLNAIIATGKPAPTMGQGENEGEFEKRLVALARRGDSIVSIDNIKRRLAATS